MYVPCGHVNYNSIFGKLLSGPVTVVFSRGEISNQPVPAELGF